MVVSLLHHTGIILTFLIAVASDASAQPKPKQPVAPTQSEEKANHSEPLAITIPGGLELVESPTAEDREQARAQREADDLQAQQLMAWASIFQAILSVASVILLGWTIFYSHKAWKEARASAEAARSTLHNERAWLMPAQGSMQRRRLENSVWRNIPFSGELLQIPLLNTGKTPATGIRLFANQSIQPITGPLEPEYPLVYGDGGEYHGIAGPDRSPCSVALMLSDDDIRRFQRREVRGFIYFRAEYRNIFTPTVIRETEMCFEVCHNGRARHPDGDVDIWSFRPIERFSKTT